MRPVSRPTILAIELPESMTTANDTALDAAAAAIERRLRSSAVGAGGSEVHVLKRRTQNVRVAVAFFGDMTRANQAVVVAVVCRGVCRARRLCVCTRMPGRRRARRSLVADDFAVTAVDRVPQGAPMPAAAEMGTLRAAIVQGIGESAAFEGAPPRPSSVKMPTAAAVWTELEVDIQHSLAAEASAPASRDAVLAQVRSGMADIGVTVSAEDMAELAVEITDCVGL